MAPSRKSERSKAAVGRRFQASTSPPAPFKRPAEVLEPFLDAMSKKHIYISHVDSKPADFKRKMFMVPVLMNVAIAALFCWRMYAIVPWYMKLLFSGMGYPNDTTFNASEASWPDLSWEIAKRALTMFIDFGLFVFLWSWPWKFVLPQQHGSPVYWRWNVGFQGKEVYVRRSRDWDKAVGDVFKDEDSMKIFLGYVQSATNPLLQEQKTGYLLMNNHWDLDWDRMVDAHDMVKQKDIAIEAFKNLVLLHHTDYGWLCYDTKAGVPTPAADEDERRRQVFAFRDALSAMGKEDLFYRWVEVVQYEASQPGGFGPEKQEAAARQIRDMFEAQSVDFDELWKETTGTEGLSGME